ncbi:MAG: hypothetical protein IJ761_06110 [Bacteroidales bacterium]|nr:hypothetical protein [Bacteroidales bacterium]MBR1799456.1 hypothetical protein [Bacteroidales bacterium]
MFIKRLIILFTLGVAPTLQGQVDFALEELAESSTGANQCGALYDQLISLSDNPININDTSSLTDLPFLSSFQHRSLRNYIILYGQLSDISELKYVPGFDSTTIAFLRPYITVEHYSPKERFNTKYIRHTLTTGIGGNIEQAKGYEDNIYEGDNLHALFTYNANYANKIEFRMSADKDPGEAWGKDNFFAASFMMKDTWRIEKLAVGRYSLQFGQGLTLWTGIAPFRLVGQSMCRNYSGIKRASTFYESDYLNGVATSIRAWQGGSVMAFASRTDGETIYGGRIEHRTYHLIAGITLSKNTFDDSLVSREYIYNRMYFRGKELTNIGMDILYNYGRMTAYGEVACSIGHSMAFVAGLTWVAGGHSTIDINCHHYAPEYYNQHAQPIYYGDPRNENGVNISIHTQLPLGINAALSGGMYNKPLLRYGIYQPSNGIENKAELSRDIMRHWQLKLRHSYRQQLRNIPNATTIAYLSEHTERQQLQAEITWHNKIWRWCTRVVHSVFNAETSPNSHGWLASSEVRYEHGSFQLTAKGLWFNIGGYYARIYQNESAPQYAWSIPSFNGTGGRTLIMIRHNISKRWNICLKYAITLYTDRETIGTGLSTIDANHVQTWHIQFRLKV